MAKTPEEIYNEAASAAHVAAMTATPTPMAVYDANPITGEPKNNVRHIVNDGPCGFAWVNIKPARGKFVNWLKKNSIGHISYFGGYDVSMGIFHNTQSLERGIAASKAFAEILKENGINCYTDSRMD